MWFSPFSLISSKEAIKTIKKKRRKTKQLQKKGIKKGKKTKLANLIPRSSDITAR
jgi:hypothetical protein